jgi:hypothetical protein
MSNYFKNGWCRHCRANLPHKFIDKGDSYDVICDNCGMITPIGYFTRMEIRRKEYLKSLKRIHGEAKRQDSAEDNSKESPKR